MISGIIWGVTIGVITGDTRSLDYGSFMGITSATLGMCIVGFTDALLVSVHRGSREGC